MGGTSCSFKLESYELTNCFSVSKLHYVIQLEEHVLHLPFSDNIANSGSIKLTVRKEIQ